MLVSCKGKKQQCNATDVFCFIQDFESKVLENNAVEHLLLHIFDKRNKANNLNIN